MLKNRRQSSGISGRDRIVVSTSRCGRDNPGSNPGHGIQKQIFLVANFISYTRRVSKQKYASAGNRTRINCLEGSYADHYTTDAFMSLGNTTEVPNVQSKNITGEPIV